MPNLKPVIPRFNRGIQACFRLLWIPRSSRGMTSCLICCLLVLFSPYQASALFDFKQGTVIRDSEIEDMLKDYINPLFRVAGLTPGSETIIILIDPTLNAAAIVGNIIVVNTGFIIQAKSPWDIIGVLAHETGHVADHHMARIEDSQKRIMVPTLLAGLLGTVAGAVAGGAEGGMAGIFGTAQIAQRSMLHYNRGQEGSADAAGLRYLTALHWSAKGLYDVLEALKGQELLLTDNQDPYIRSHPLTQDRLDTIKQYLTTSPYTNAPLPATFQEKFDRVQTKIKAFLSHPAKTLQKYPPSQTTLLARYARTIAYLKQNQIDKSLEEINDLLKEHPKDPYFWELKGQILFVGGRVKDAVAPYEKAVSLRPKDTLLKIDLAQTLVESNISQNLQKARDLLRKLTDEDPDEASTWRLLAIAQGKLNDIGNASLSLAEYFVRTGDTQQAKIQTKKALGLLPKSSPAYLRAQDIQSSLKDAPEK